MRQIDVDHIPIFDKAKTITEYWPLLNFFKEITEQYYLNNNIYYENHHIYPNFEFGTKKEVLPITVCLPFKYHFLAHFYRALEFESVNKHISYGHYNVCKIMILGKLKSLSKVDIHNAANCFKQLYYDNKEKVLTPWNKDPNKVPIVPKTKEEKFQIKSRITASQNIGRHWYTDGIQNKFTYSCPDGFYLGQTLDKEVIAYRKIHGKQAMLQNCHTKQARQKNANKRFKPVKCIETNKIYKSVYEANELTNISYGMICKAANPTDRHKTAGGFHWEFV